MKHIEVYGSEQPALVDEEDFAFVSRFGWYLCDGQAFTLINGRAVEMGYLILHPGIVEEPSAN
jgi:hypothetical protein